MDQRAVNQPQPSSPVAGLDGGAGALIRGLSALLQVEQEARQAPDVAALGFVMVNRTLALLPATVALLWRPAVTGAPRLERISGLPGVERGAPFVLWAERLLAVGAGGEGDAGACRVMTPAQAPGLAQDWSQWAPPQALWCPLRTGDGTVLGGLWLAREAPWSASDLALAARLAETFTHAWERLAVLAHQRRGAGFGRRGTRLRRWLLGGAGLALGVAGLACPVTETTLAPAEIVADQPLVVTAPTDGVIQTVDVMPNQPVVVGDRLFSLNETALRNRYEVAVMAQRVAEAEAHKTRQLAFQDANSQAALGVIEAQIALRAAEARFAADMLERIQIRAEQDGIVLFGDPNELRGKPVMTGERVMTIADPARAEMVLWLPAADATAFPPDAAVSLYLNVAPLQPVRGTLYQASYEALPTPEGVVAYRLKARLTGDRPPPRIGLKGTARIAGTETPLALALLRRPLAALRRWGGW